jgi:integrase/recombinase XerD
MAESSLPQPVSEAAPDPLVRVIEDWLAPLPRATLRTYLQAVNRILPSLPAGRLDLRPIEARQCLEQWERQYAPATVEIMLVVARRLWARLQATGLCRENPWQGFRVTTPKDTRAERILTPREVGRLIRAAKRHRALILVLYYTGARVAEIAHLRWEDIHRHDDGGYTLTLYGKGGKTRQVPVPPLVVEALEARAPDHPRTGWVWPGRGGAGPITTEALWKNVKTVTKWAGIAKNPSPHWFRHSYASHLLEHGVGVVEVQHLLGHARLDTTAEYLHLSAHQVRAAGLRLDPPDLLEDLADGD